MNASGSQIIFLKLGGSLITDKRLAEKPRLDVIGRLAQEIAEARRLDPSQQMVVGHGSGSFGHVVGRRYGTRDGVTDETGWYGFAATADAASRLNRLVTGALLKAGLPAWTVQPSVALHCEDGVIVDGPATTVSEALANGLVPVIHGDVALDGVRGGTIVSTEEIFEWLAKYLPPKRLILVGEVDGIYTADPTVDLAAVKLDEITPKTLADIQDGLGGSHGVDVTGGMAAKVAQSMRLANQFPGLEVVVCGGLVAGNLRQVLIEPSTKLGTRLHVPLTSSGAV